MKRAGCLSLVLALALLAGCGGGSGSRFFSSSTLASARVQPPLAGPWHFALQSTQNPSTSAFLEVNLLGDGTAATASVPFTATPRHMAAFLKPGPPTLTNGGPVVGGGDIPVWSGFGPDMNLSVQLQESGANWSATIQSGLNMVVIDGSGTINADGTQISGTYQFSDYSDKGAFTASKVPLWTGSYAGSITNDPLLGSSSQLLVVVKENADFSVSIAGFPETDLSGRNTGLSSGFAIGNLILLPADSDRPANLLGLRPDNTGLSVNFWEEGGRPFPYVGVLRKQ